MDTPVEKSVGAPSVGQVSPLEEVSRVKNASLWLLVLFGAAMVVAGFLAGNLDSGLLWSLFCFLAWSGQVVLIHYLFFHLQVTDHQQAEIASRAAGEAEARIEHTPGLPWFQRKGQVVWLIGGGVLVLACLAASLRMTAPLAGSHTALVQLSGILLLGLAFALYFMGRYVAFVQSKQNTNRLNAPLHLTRLAFGICLLTAVCLLASLYVNLDLSLWVGRLIGLTTALLILDAWIRAGMTVFQPQTLLREMPPLGGSFILEALLRGGHPLDAVAHHIEASFGVKLEHDWIVPFIRQTLEPVVLLGIILLWLSTCLTAVPVQSQGVRVRWGRYLTPVLGPGLYVTWPWPAESIDIVPTERIEQIALGFEEDLGGPMLWTETHYEGEQSLLVGNGEELLSISVPVYYRIKDPIAYLETTTDGRAALISLAYRQMLSVTEGQDSFGVMTVERAALAHALQTSLQREVDRMHLGLEVIYVGLKDIHPPVAVAAAFQDVISAEEQKEADIHQAAAYRVQTLARARQTANRLRTVADAQAAQRTMLATGESVRFVQLATADAANTNLFRFRLRMEALETALATPQKIVLTRTASTNDQFYLDLRGLGRMPWP